MTSHSSTHTLKAPAATPVLFFHRVIMFGPAWVSLVPFISRWVDGAAEEAGGLGQYLIGGGGIAAARMHDDGAFYLPVGLLQQDHGFRASDTSYLHDDARAAIN